MIRSILEVIKTASIPLFFQISLFFAFYLAVKYGILGALVAYAWAPILWILELYRRYQKARIPSSAYETSEARLREILKELTKDRPAPP